MDKRGAQLQARLKWEVACERMAIALNPPPGVARDGVHDLEAALGLVQAALEEVREAFKDSPEGH
ncbi:hypothetical protein QTH97_18760 [Variovorax sp. J22R24]|uniref:hypothetical protein n=1 Tax=Variovorax gracilis TaxID=3053502 RepID=UPI0025760808|nr:hypothetical protein [Variovorax sp. J22R24]MDM0106994.1 hypothetical protein [Variovorax sp. J22R24]